MTELEREKAERERQRIERVLMAYGWYFRKYMIARAGGDRNEIQYWKSRTLDFQSGVQKADPFGKWSIRFAKAGRELEAEIMGGQDNDRILGAIQGNGNRGESAGGGDYYPSPRRRRRRDGYAAESGYAEMRQDPDYYGGSVYADSPGRGWPEAPYGYSAR